MASIFESLDITFLTTRRPGSSPEPTAPSKPQTIAEALRFSTGGPSNEQRAIKRRKTNHDQSAATDSSHGSDSNHSIVLSRIDLDLNFPDAQIESLKTHGSSRPSIDLSLESYKRPEPDMLAITLWDATASTVLELHATSTSAILDKIGPHLDFATLVAITKEGKKRINRTRIPFCRTVLIVPGVNCQSVKLCIELRWRVGLSAVETQSLRAGVREDLAILENYLPDATAAERTPWALSDFFSAVHVPPTNESVSPRIQQSLVETELYPFQQRAVNWLIRREGFELSELGDLKEIASPSAWAPVSFKPIKDAAGRACYVSHLRAMVVIDPNTVWDAAKQLRGGILAEEMGLGKTVELIALMCLNKRRMPKDSPPSPNPPNSLIPSAATLIITPPSILEQWKKEINTHAPELKVLHYQGLPPASAPSKEHQVATVNNLLNYDVVLTTYNVLSKEIHFATPAPDRSLRQAPKHERKMSPLVQIEWWRVCLDEAQMIESGVSQAAQVARIIPRVNAWAVSGTPLRKDIQDLRGLLAFLWYEPFASSRPLWDRLDKASFREIFNRISLRHTKDRIRDELQLPPQKRVVITVPFTVVEEQNYSDLVRQMCNACWLTPDGEPTREDRSIDHPEVIERMREWLMRLRQTCLHANVGKRNRRAMGARNGPLRTVGEVLEAMIDQNDASLKVEIRESILLELKRGHIRAHANDDRDRVDTALKYYHRALTEAQDYRKVCQNEIIEEKRKLGRNVLPSDDMFLDHEEIEHDETNGRLVVKRRMLRSALELEHACFFYIGTVLYQRKMDENLTTPDSAQFNALQSQEDEWYGKAKAVRKELLKESQTRAQRHMALANLKASTPLQKIPEFLDLGGIESRRVLETIDEVTDNMNSQVTHLEDWRKKIVDILAAPLVDQDEDQEITGNEYADSTNSQDQLYVYMMAVRALIADRNRVVSGLHDPLVDLEMKTAERDAKGADPNKSRGHAPELFLQLAQTRRTLQPTSNIGSLKGGVSALRSLVSSLQRRSGTGDDRASAELAIAEKYLGRLQKLVSEQSKLIADLEKELDMFRTTMNSRLEYYRQLQHISDTVAPWKEELDPVFDYLEYERQKHAQEARQKTLAGLKTKQAYLTNLRHEGEEQEMKQECIICQDVFEQGVFTSCGHRYCTDCINQWWQEHRTCPLCKQKLHSRDFKQITFKPSEVTAQEEMHGNGSASHASSPSSTTSSIYSDMSETTMREIKMIDLAGSYGSKIDMIARHLLWIRNNDPGAKTIIFSQFGDFLQVLRTACKQWKIGTSSIHDKDGIQKFKQDPSKGCFLLDAKSDSSGLNLVNATYVFLCEPLINPAIELQAIARVHRIGQQRPTTVIMYLVSNTVEEAIYDISVARRMEHVDRSMLSSPASASGSTSPMLHEKMIDKANSAELESTPVKQLLRRAGDGEVVGSDDLWGCLFGKKGKVRDGKSEALGKEVGRHLRGVAAETRALEAAMEGLSSASSS
ncbi:unnamed protein product [Periconia digitata]|uniref:Uncharacterized protein n=1 Tax=Periconia digitata TaxID=1303443 RepID=A0A9W4UWI7_9PLEO|nr:unnamed protein product [Periconia digitata]